MNIKTPVELELIYADMPEHDEANIVDDSGRTLAVDVDAQVAAEIVQAVNAYPKLMGAVKLAKQFLDALRIESGIGHFLSGPEREIFEHVDNVLTDAIQERQNEHTTD